MDPPPSKRPRVDPIAAAAAKDLEAGAAPILPPILQPETTESGDRTQVEVDSQGSLVAEPTTDQSSLMDLQREELDHDSGPNETCSPDSWRPGPQLSPLTTEASGAERLQELGPREGQDDGPGAARQHMTNHDDPGMQRTQVLTTGYPTTSLVTGPRPRTAPPDPAHSRPSALPHVGPKAGPKPQPGPSARVPKAKMKGVTFSSTDARLRGLDPNKPKVDPGLPPKVTRGPTRPGVRQLPGPSKEHQRLGLEKWLIGRKPATQGEVARPGLLAGQRQPTQGDRRTRRNFRGARGGRGRSKRLKVSPL